MVTLVSAFIIGIHRPSTNELIAAFTVQVDIRSLDEERLTIVGEGVAAVVAIIGRPVRAGVDSDEVHSTRSREIRDQQAGTTIDAIQANDTHGDGLAGRHFDREGTGLLVRSEEVDQLTFVVEGHIVGGAVHILGVVQPVE